jgi:hypothetical protein
LSGKAAAVVTGTTLRKRQELDLVRTLVVGGLIAFHTACIFVPGQFPSQPISFALMMFVFFAKLWGMPLLFVVAGIGAWHSLSERTAGGFARERLRRLLPPLVVGVVVLVPPQVYFLLKARGHDPGPYLQFLGRFLDLRLVVGFPAFVRGADAAGPFELGHLWFLYDLLLYSLLLLPVFLYLRRNLDQGWIAWLTGRCQRPWGVFLLALPVVLIEVVLGIVGPGSWHSYAHIVFLLSGFLIAADGRLAEVVSRRWGLVLLVGVAALPALFIITFFDLGGPDRLLGTDYHPWSLAFRLLKATAGWAWTFALFGFAISRMRPWALAAPASPRRVMGYANQAVLPFYVLHQTPIIVIGFYVVQWKVGIVPKYLAIALGSLLVTVLAYELGVRRIGLARLMFGMPPLNAWRAAEASHPPVAGDRR